MAPEAAVVQLIKLTVTEGKGIEGDVMRRVDYYYTLDGVQVVRVDEWEEEQRQADASPATRTTPP